MARSRRDVQRWAGRGTTAERDYGHRHQKVREQRLAVYRPGDICAHGGERMPYPLPVQVRDPDGRMRLKSPWLDLPHNADRSGYLPGLSCRRHNRGEGATRGNRMQGQRRAMAKAGMTTRTPVPLRTSRQW
jgi:hypothetical protein